MENGTKLKNLDSLRAFAAILKIRREKHKTGRHITRKAPRELFYEDRENHFGINFFSGIDAKKLTLKLKKASGKI